MDDYSRYILSWELCDTMKAKDVKETIVKAFRKVNISSSDPPKILSDNGPCYVGIELAEYFDKMNIKHVRGRPFHPQTQGKIERYHRTLKNVIKLDNYYTPGELKYRLSEFIDYYNHKRYHESLNNLTPADIYFGRRANKLMRREIIKKETIKKRRINYQLLTNKV